MDRLTAENGLAQCDRCYRKFDVLFWDEVKRMALCGRCK